MEVVYLILIVSGVVIGNELVIRILRSHSLSIHKMVNRNHKQKNKQNHKVITSNKERN
ncbi:hypothetical protein [Acidianus bottle-shaped virus 2 strain ABV2]|uniref:Uncharacterized protein n=1 Tax=Acidianus bottle-shaped virus 2 strain ABV2 TaxID=1732173 RepID=A0A0N9NI53_9VIRU|nr:hypothetical protein AVU01_gp47 [Acidianus bottle-shaped virus 2 strain ABV2]ALG96795.1 hypothetical protein [Acidianus bottle-shaped virus 2 strain ABV2]